MKELMKHKFLIGIVLLLICSLSFVNAATATLRVEKGAATGNGYYWPNITADVHSDILGYTPGWSGTGPYNPDTDRGHKIFLVNGKPIYCIEPGIGVSYDELTYTTDHQYDAEKHARIYSDELAWISYFGYQSPAVNHSDINYYDATQQLVWQTIYPGLEVVWYTDRDNMVDSDTNDVAGKVEEIKSLIEEAKKMPEISIPSSVSVGEVVTVKGDFSNYTVKVSNSKDATIVSQTSSELKIRFNTNSTVKITITKNFKGSNNINRVVYTSDEAQDIISLGLKLPTVEKNFTVSAKGGNIELQKIRLLPLVSQDFTGNATLEGAVYKVTYEGEVEYPSFELITDKNGFATTKGTEHEGKLPIGTYIIKEIKASEGYLLDPDTYIVELTEGNIGTVQEVTSREELITARIQIVKVEASDKTGQLTPEANKVFGLYPLFGENQEEAIETLVTDKDGFAISGNIPYGKYLLKQEEPYGTSEPIEPIEIEINEENEGEILKYVLANAPYSAKVKVVKRDKETEAIIAKAGVRFKIKWLEDENGNEINEYISQEITLSTGKKKVLEYFETDSDGTFITPEALKPGKYQLEEIRGVEGYILNEEALEFEIFPSTEGIELDEEYGLLLTLDFYNEKEVENPKTSDNTMYMVIGGIIVVGLVGAISYKKIKE